MRASEGRAAVERAAGVALAALLAWVAAASTPVTAAATTDRSSVEQSPFDLARPLTRDVRNVTDAKQTSGLPAYFYFGGPQNWTVPDGVNAISVAAAGAAGGRENNLDPGSGAPIYKEPGGPGAHVAAVVPVNPGDTITVIVGGAGGEPDYSWYNPPNPNPGPNIPTPVCGDTGLGGSGYGSGGKGGEAAAVGGCGSGGGGATAVLANNKPLLVAGGGGGAGSWSEDWGGAGGTGGGSSGAGGNGEGSGAGKGGCGGCNSSNDGSGGGNAWDEPVNGAGGGGGGGGSPGGKGGGHGSSSSGGGGAGGSYIAPSLTGRSVFAGTPTTATPPLDGSANFSIAPPAISVSSSSNPAGLDDTVTLTATLKAPGSSGPTPTGTVSFVDVTPGTTRSLGTVPLDDEGRASVKVPSPEAGSRAPRETISIDMDVEVSYSGDSTYPLTSSSYTQYWECDPCPGSR